jgi:hypothetical protein
MASRPNGRPLRRDGLGLVVPLGGFGRLESIGKMFNSTECDAAGANHEAPVRNDQVTCFTRTHGLKFGETCDEFGVFR